MSHDTTPTSAAAELYHTYFTGSMLTVASRRSGNDAAEWVFRVSIWATANWNEAMEYVRSGLPRLAGPFGRGTPRISDG